MFFIHLNFWRKKKTEKRFLIKYLYYFKGNKDFQNISLKLRFLTYFFILYSIGISESIKALMVYVVRVTTLYNVTLW